MKEVEEVIPFETLCNNHNHTVYLLQRYKKTGNIEYVNQAIKLIRYCKKQGQHMENRLRKYRYAIEELGFTRKTKKTK